MLKFDFFFSGYFWVAFFLIVLLARLTRSKPRLSAALLLLISSSMLLTIPHFGLVNLILLALMMLATFALGSLLGANRTVRSPGSNKSLLAVGIGIVIAFLAFFKYRALQKLILGSGVFSSGDAASPLFFIGVSYFSFKMIHFLVEAYRGKIEHLSILNYANYIAFFPAFISGPINRYNHFSSQLEAHSPKSLRHDLKAGLERIVHGLFKKLVLVQVLFPHILGSPSTSNDHWSLTGVILGLYAYALYFYFDFSGYSDLAIGCARLLGFELPENFNHPFLKRNIRELWTNWHASLTGWLVNYIYWPLVRKLRNITYFRTRAVFLSNIGMFLTFIVCGMWHGESLNFIVWGAYHGLGISLLTIYQREKRKIPSPAIQKYFRSRLSSIVGAFMTFNYFSLGLAFFVLDLDKLWLLLQNIT